MIRSQEEFEVRNKRRWELIEKEHRGFTPEESHRRFDLNPGWKQEYKRRCWNNLTDAERDELADLQQQCGEWLSKICPLPDIRELEEALERATRRELGIIDLHIIISDE